MLIGPSDNLSITSISRLSFDLQPTKPPTTNHRNTTAKMAPSANPQDNIYAGLDANTLAGVNVSSPGFLSNLTFNNNAVPTTNDQELQSLQCNQLAWVFAGLKIYGIPVAIGALLVVWLLGFLLRRLVHPAFRKPRQHPSLEVHELAPQVNRGVDVRDPPPVYHQQVS